MFISLFGSQKAVLEALGTPEFSDAMKEELADMKANGLKEKVFSIDGNLTVAIKK